MELLISIFEVQCETTTIFTVWLDEVLCGKAHQNNTIGLQIKQIWVSIKRDCKCNTYTVKLVIFLLPRGIMKWVSFSNFCFYNLFLNICFKN